MLVREKAALIYFYSVSGLWPLSQHHRSLGQVTRTSFEWGPQSSLKSLPGEMGQVLASRCGVDMEKKHRMEGETRVEGTLQFPSSHFLIPK